MLVEVLGRGNKVMWEAILVCWGGGDEWITMVVREVLWRSWARWQTRVTRLGKSEAFIMTTWCDAMVWKLLGFCSGFMCEAAVVVETGYREVEWESREVPGLVWEEVVWEVGLEWLLELMAIAWWETMVRLCWL